MTNATCVHFVPLSQYDWSFNRVGPLPWNPTVFSIIAAFSALAFWSTVELTVQVYFTFKKHTGLYFWSILGTTWGVTLHAVGFLLKLFAPNVNWVFSTIVAEIGWIGMVSGFSVVLYSRLHLVSLRRRTLKLVLIMIIVDAFLFHTLTVVTQFGLSSGHAHHKWASIMAPMERTQVTAFTIQETIISGLYMWATYQVLKGRFNNTDNKTWKVMLLLFAVQVIVILIDVIIITLDYVQYFNLKAIIHSFIYAIKLKLEFVVLNQLVEVASNGLAPGGLASISDSSLERAIPSPTPAPPRTIENEKKNWWSVSSLKKSSLATTATPSSRQPSISQPIPTPGIFDPETYQPAAATLTASPVAPGPPPKAPGRNLGDIFAVPYDPHRVDSNSTLQATITVPGSTDTLGKVENPQRWYNEGNDSYESQSDLSDLERKYLGRGSEQI